MRNLTAGAPVAELGSSEWWATFWLSPPAAALGAIAAAALALLGAWLNVRAQREIERAKQSATAVAAELVRQQQLEDRAAEQWWETLRWVEERLDDFPVTQGGAVMTRLLERAPDATATAVVLSLIAAYVERTEAGDDR